MKAQAACVDRAPASHWHIDSADAAAATSETPGTPRLMEAWRNKLRTA